ncbi:unnamed protein product [Polarella glacialis]|uniref:Alkylglycerone-phosphate synthase n=1 Tax=Polarella glacialis TaxID=89957 RepID=A0A813LRF9_POLGL|nr:unnamed protein product [Polarella glacialis]
MFRCQCKHQKSLSLCPASLFLATPPFHDHYSGATLASCHSREWLASVIAASRWGALLPSASFPPAAWALGCAVLSNGQVCAQAAQVELCTRSSGYGQSWIAGFGGRQASVSQQRLAIRVAMRGGAKIGKSGLFSPIVEGAKVAIGPEELNKWRAEVIKAHTKVISYFVDTSQSGFGKIALQRLFEAADANGDGKLCKEEVRSCLNSLGFSWMDHERVEGLVAKGDLNGDEEISAGFHVTYTYSKYLLFLLITQKQHFNGIEEIDFEEFVLQAPVWGGAASGEAGYALTFAIAYLRDFGMDYRILSESLETMAPWSCIRTVWPAVEAAVQAEHRALRLPGKPFMSCRMTQLYDEGAVLYMYIAVCTAGLAPERALEAFGCLEHAARNAAMSAGGCLSHHHGVGKLRSSLLPNAQSPALMQAVHGLKTSVDPDNVLGARNGAWAQYPQEAAMQGCVETMDRDGLDLAMH